MATELDTNSAATENIATQTPAEPRNDLRLLQVKSNDRLDAEAQAAKQAEAIANAPAPMSMLASFIMDKFREAERAMMMFQTEDMMDQLRRRAGTYSPQRLAEIKKQGGAQIFFKVTEAKCLTVEALISEVLWPSSGERPWDLKPTPRPSLPPRLIGPVVEKIMAEIEMQENSVDLSDEEVEEIAKRIRDEQLHRLEESAKERATNMATLIEDEFVEGNFYEALEDCISDAVSVGTCIIKGPYLQMERSMQWNEDNNTPNIMDLPCMKWKRVDPLYFFPSRGSTTCQDATYLTEVDSFTREQLVSMIGIPGWNEENIRTVLRENPNGTHIGVYTDPERATLERRRSDDKNNPDDLFQGVWYSGEAHGDSLADWGIDRVKPDEVHEIISLVIANLVLHVRLNKDPLHRRQYNSACYKPVKGSFWGQGVPRLMDDIQDNCNASGRHMLNNLAIGSGPQVIIRDVDQHADGQDITSLYPWKIWQFNDPNRTGKAPVEFFNPDNHAEQLMNIFKFFLAQADERVGIPQYQPAPGQGQGAAGTATGLTILLNQSSRTIKKSIRNIDGGIIRPNVQAAFVWNMLHIPDPSIKGDVKIVASGAMGLFVKEQQQLRVAEMLRLTANPIDLQIMGQPGRAELLRSGMDGLNIDTNSAVPSKQEIERRVQEQAAQQQASMVGVD
jgi:hypothetical protein